MVYCKPPPAWDVDMRERVNAALRPAAFIEWVTRHRPAMFRIVFELNELQPLREWLRESFVLDCEFRRRRIYISVDWQRTFGWAEEHAFLVDQEAPQWFYLFYDRLIERRRGERVTWQLAYNIARELEIDITTIELPTPVEMAHAAVEWQTQKGIDNYGKPLDPKDMLSWLKESIQETADSLVYQNAALHTWHAVSFENARLRAAIATAAEIIQECEDRQIHMRLPATRRTKFEDGYKLIKELHMEYNGAPPAKP